MVGAYQNTTLPGKDIAGLVLLGIAGVHLVKRFVWPTLDTVFVRSARVARFAPQPPDAFNAKLTI